MRRGLVAPNRKDRQADQNKNAFYRDRCRRVSFCVPLASLDITVHTLGTVTKLGSVLACGRFDPPGSGDDAHSQVQSFCSRMPEYSLFVQRH